MCRRQASWQAPVRSSSISHSLNTLSAKSSNATPLDDLPDHDDITRGAFGLRGRVAVVTGASSGLGAHFATVLAEAGASVVLTARREERLHELAEQLQGALVIAADISSELDRERLVRETLDHHGRIDILVNNAGVGTGVAIEDETTEQFRTAMEVNVIALWHMAKLCAPSMISSGSGSIVNIASILGFVGSTPIKQSHYCASKGAVVNLTRELALQWARKGVRVNALCPGWFPSEMTDGMDTDPGSQRFITANSPIPRMGQLSELDGPLLLLASDAGSFMTGHSLIVDGGWTAR
jgi:NAD(P)-dependent dehydrogenase (short-subunit alcohol dehydrogenase family)